MCSEKTEFPDTLEGFGYEFVDGELRNIETGDPFQFDVRRKDHSYNQRRYEALGNVITEHIYGLLDQQGLNRIQVPISGGPPHSFFFASPDAWTNEKALLILIHGSGAVRAGQWARSLIINDCLDSGSQLPYIRAALERQFGVVVLNTNYNRAMHAGRNRLIKGNEDPSSHGLYVWKHFISQAKAPQIAIVAHSAGGIVTMNLAQGNADDFMERVFSVCLTDSVHGPARSSTSEWWKHVREIGQNWVGSTKSLDTPTATSRTGIKCVSAGTTKHELTSYTAMESVWAFIDSKYALSTGADDSESQQDAVPETEAVPEPQEIGDNVNDEHSDQPEAASPEESLEPEPKVIKKAVEL